MENQDNNVKHHDDKLLIDHDYDGIKELNNPPPPWLMYIFYATIIWSVFYVFYYHVFYGPSQDEEYAIEMQEAVEALPVQTFDENNILLLTSKEDLDAGASIYQTKNCDMCHGVTNIGPNLTDNHWVHGNKPEEVFKVIKYGVTEKGMLAYKGQLSDKQIQQLMSFILIANKGAETLNTKGPEGKLYE